VFTAAWRSGPGWIGTQDAQVRFWKARSGWARVPSWPISSASVMAANPNSMKTATVFVAREVTRVTTVTTVTMVTPGRLDRRVLQRARQARRVRQALLMDRPDQPDQPVRTAQPDPQAQLGQQVRPDRPEVLIQA
jgi:hypothetical protein